MHPSSAVQLTGSTLVRDTFNVQPNLQTELRAIRGLIANNGLDKPQERIEIKKLLEAAYVHLIEANKSSKVSLQDMAEFFMHVGRYWYTYDYPNSIQAFGTALELLIHHVEQKNMNTAPLLEGQTTDSLMKQLPKRNPDEFYSGFETRNLETIHDLKALQALGEAFKFLGFCCQNMEAYQDTKIVENLNRFNIVYDLAIACQRQVGKKSHDKVEAEAANFEACVDVPYNTGRMRYYAAHPNDHQGALKTLEPICSYLEEKMKAGFESKTIQAKAEEKDAQIDNIRTCTMLGIIKASQSQQEKDFYIAECWKCVSKAIEKGETKPDSVSPKLLANFRSTKAAIGLNFHLEDPKKCLELAEKAIQFAKSIGGDDIYFEGYYLNACAASLALIPIDLDKANAYLAEAERIAKVHAANGNPYAEKLAKLQEDMKKIPS